MGIECKLRSAVSVLYLLNISVYYIEVVSTFVYLRALLVVEAMLDDCYRPLELRQ